jgi:peptidoglycan/LPS O-acetylase OafA/YrhL
MQPAQQNPEIISASPAAARLDFIDAFRGLACLWVVLLHFQHGFLGAPDLQDANFLSAFIDTATMGYLGVNLFLVLSGFCLFYPLARKQPDRSWKIEPREFMRRRVRRILPPYYAALVLALLVVLTVSRASRDGRWPLPTDALVHVLMAHNLFPATADSLNYVFWSLALEMQLYLVFPLLLWFGRLGGMRQVLAIALAVSLAWQLLMTTVIGDAVGGGVGYVAYNALPGRMLEFAAGMAAALWVAHPRRGQHLWAAGGLCLALPVAVWLSLLVGGDNPALAPFWPWQNYAWVVVFFSAILLAAHVTRAPGAWDAAIAPVARIGVISYSVYLVHVPALGVFARLVAGREFEPGTLVVLFFVAALPVVLAAGFAFFLLFERPFLHASKPPEWPLNGVLLALRSTMRNLISFDAIARRKRARRDGLAAPRDAVDQDQHTV